MQIKDLESQATEAQVAEFNAYLDTLKPQQLLGFLLDKNREPFVRFLAATRPSMKKSDVHEACETIAQDREDSDQARLMALSLLPPKQGVKLAKSMALDRTEKDATRLGVLFEYPHFTKEDALPIIEHIMTDKSETKPFRSVVLGTVCGHSIKEMRKHVGPDSMLWDKPALEEALSSIYKQFDL